MHKCLATVVSQLAETHVARRIVSKPVLNCDFIRMRSIPSQMPFECRETIWSVNVQVRFVLYWRGTEPVYTFNGP